MKQIIPAKEILTCDICKYTQDVVSFRTSSAVDLKRDGLDYQGCPVGPGGLKYDLCDACGGALEDLIRKAEKAKTFYL